MINRVKKLISVATILGTTVFGFYSINAPNPDRYDILKNEIVKAREIQDDGAGYENTKTPPLEIPVLKAKDMGESTNMPKTDIEKPVNDTPQPVIPAPIVPPVKPPTQPPSQPPIQPPDKYPGMNHEVEIELGKHGFENKMENNGFMK